MLSYYIPAILKAHRFLYSTLFRIISKNHKKPGTAVTKRQLFVFGTIFQFCLMKL